ncbi:putative quinol monooxygenase [Microbacterium amylolyticum]|uniref:Quinol monooxygenase YgiN n=1 Tax=Microbacterium amylolyticum TaxID=936337 RepID=A0ABS4ZG17_9MICO|nr:antibiotic biosynthesis monooxygenase [Microbacterium amylolyticum]MBP2436221.1 quinol monooxygenase YgiN [Microbacterium amylolyticum]
MAPVRLTGELICQDEAQAKIVRSALPEHVLLTRSEPGCTAFDVVPSHTPLVWNVTEEFVSDAAFDTHQARVRTSAWGLATRGIERRYVIERDEG